MGFSLWFFHIAVENGSFIGDFPIKTSIYSGFSMALNCQMLINVTMTMENDDGIYGRYECLSLMTMESILL